MTNHKVGSRAQQETGACESQVLVQQVAKHRVEDYGIKGALHRGAIRADSKEGSTQVGSEILKNGLWGCLCDERERLPILSHNGLPQKE